MRKPIQFIIPAAGSGSRFANKGYLLPKPLIEVGNLPMLLWVLGNFDIENGDRVLIISQKKHQIQNQIRNILKSSNLNCDYLECDSLTDGPASTVLLAENWLVPELPVVVANSDQFVSRGLSDFLSQIRLGTSDSYILTMEASGNKWSYIQRDHEDNIINIVEKIEISREATVGIYAWAKASYMVDAIKSQLEANFRVNNEFYIAPTYNFLMEKGLEIQTYSCGTHADAVHGLGTPEDLEIFLAREDFNLYLKILQNKFF